MHFKDMPRRSRLLAILALVGLALLAAGLGIGIYRAATLDSGESAAETTSTSAPDSSSSSASGGQGSASPEPIPDLYEAASPGVVEITVSGVSDGEDFGPFEPPGSVEAQGSGFVVDDEGTILTNEHVVEGADQIEVTFADGTTVDAELVGTDASTDVGVIDVDVSADELTPLPLGDSSPLRVGESVVAIGSPFGFEGTITAGIISALDRTVDAPNGFPIVGAIQTDAPINSGNSGGPLLNLDGEVIGINAQIESPSGGNVGVGFAVPIDSARRAADAILAGETVAYPYLGARLADAPSGGAAIAAVQPDSPAEEAGLEDGDVVTAVDGEEVRSADDLVAAIAQLAPGDEVTLTVERDGETHEIDVTIGRRPS
jgi:putative serine protease PepD